MKSFSFTKPFAGRLNNKNATQTRRLQMESLEDRQMLSATPYENLAPTASADVVVASSEIAPAPIDLGDDAFALNTSDDLSYNAHDLAVLEAAGIIPSMPVSYHRWTEVDGELRLQMLNCSSRHLTGTLDVSGCTSLTSLNCNSNDITNLNLSGCTALTVLRCQNTKLSSLDLSDCPNLTELYASNVSNLTSLDLSGFTALESISVNNNPLLTSLDVSGCTSLTTVGCYDNALTSLDVAGCTSLRKLEAGGNNLTSLDVSSCTTLSNLSVYHNNLTSVDVSANVDMQMLTFDYTVESVTLSPERSVRTYVNSYFYPMSFSSSNVTAVDGNGDPVALDTSSPQSVLRVPSTDAVFPYTYTYTQNGEVVATTVINGATVGPVAPETPGVAWTATPTAFVVRIDPVDGATSYTLEYADNPDFENSVTKVYKTTGPKTLQHLPFGVTYYYRLHATSADGLDSPAAEFSGAVGQLRDLEATAEATGNNAVVVDLQNVYFASGYAVEYSKNADFSDSQTRTFNEWGSKTILGLERNTEYFIRAKALGDGTTRCDGAWTYLTATTWNEYEGDLAAPEFVALSSLRTQLVFKFNAVENATKYTLQYSTDATFATFKTKTYTSAGVKTVSNLDSGTTYYFRLIATSPDFEDSLPTEFAGTTTGTAPSAAVLDQAFANYFDDDLNDDLTLI